MKILNPKDKNDSYQNREDIFFMKATFISRENNNVKFTMEFTAEEFENAQIKAYQASKDQFQIDGFRKGKAPRSIIEKHYGEGIFFEEAIDELFRENYGEALKELDLEVIDAPAAEFSKIAKGEGFTITITVPCFPIVEVKDYKGVEIEKLRGDLRQKFGREFSLEVNEIRRPEVEAQLVAENIAQQLERRVAFRRAMKRTVSMARKFGGEGIKVTCSGRLAGAEIARTEWYRDGRVPLQTLRADIDYGFAEAHTTYGIIGVKVWIYKGEILDKEVDQ